MEFFTFRLRNLLTIPIAITILFLIPTIISYTNTNFLKRDINDKVATTSLLLTLISYENISIRLAIKEDYFDYFLYSSNLFEEITNIKIDDLKSYIRSVMPGNLRREEHQVPHYFALESAPPLEVLLHEREISAKELEVINMAGNLSISGATEKNNKKIFIYHTHSWEAFKSNKEKNIETNITDIGVLFGKALREKGIETTIDKTNISEKLKEKGWGTSQSYRVTREIVQSVMSSNHYDYYFDLHRDSVGKDLTTIVLDQKPYAKLAFVIGEENKQHEKNLELANFLHQFIEKKYPGVSRGVLGKYGDGVDGIYNQDLSPNSLVIEVGGVENNMNELKNTINILALAISQHFWQALEVNGIMNRQPN